MKIPENIQTLIERYQAGNATEAEKMQLDEWYHSFNDNQANITTAEISSEQQLADKIKDRLFKTIHSSEDVIVFNRKTRLRRLIAVAASIVLLVTPGAYFMYSTKPAKESLTKTTPAETNQKNDVAPGSNKALLTLADGSTIILDSASKGVISQQGEIDVQKLSNGQLTYTINGREITENDDAFFNTISTPRGGQYQVTLSDGTKVWLNAASSIRFPVAFTGTERVVHITGEAYFEVAKNKEKPFKVKTNISEVEVLGTHFNVNAYEDEITAKTTLLEGSVKISVPSVLGSLSQNYLLPGQQAAIAKTGKIIIVENADTEEAVAWMKGHFQFNSSDLKAILRQISRWYDVEIEYKGNVNLHFTGQLTRNEYVSKVFEKLALTGEVHFKIDGRKITVSP